MLLVPAITCTKPSIELEYLQSAQNTASGSTYTFASQNLGAADTSRTIIVGASGGATSETSLVISSVSVQAISGTQIATNVRTGGEEITRASLWRFAVPTGTTGNVVVTFDRGIDGAGIGLWKLTGGNPVPTSSNTAVGGSSAAASLTIPSGGFGVGYYGSCDNGSLGNVTWTNLTELFDSITGSNEPYYGRHSGAMSSTPGALTRTAAGSGAATVLLLAAWGP